MNVWQDRTGQIWYGEWRRTLKGKWNYEMSPQGSETDAAEVEFSLLEASVGPLKRGKMVDKDNGSRYLRVFEEL